MTRDLFDPLDLELRRMLRDLNEGPPAPRDARLRLRGALQLGGGPFPPDGSFAHETSRFNEATQSASQIAADAKLAKTAAHVSRTWAMSAVGAAALIGGWFALGPGGGDRVNPSSPAQQNVAEQLPTEAQRAVTTSDTVDPGTAPRDDARVERLVAAPASASAAGAPSASTAGKSDKRAADSSLAAERRLLDAARAALVAGDPGIGLERLTRHARQFPSGALAEERTALTVDALVAAGRHDDAKRRAEAFYARYPGSIFAPSVGAALQAIP